MYTNTDVHKHTIKLTFIDSDVHKHTIKITFIKWNAHKHTMKVIFPGLRTSVFFGIL